MRIVLVHGAWQTAWCWHLVAPLLTRLGHECLAVEYDGTTMTGYVASVHRAIDGRHAMLAGHSLGGMVISAAAEQSPDFVTGLAYLAAYLPRDGESARQLGKEDTASLVGRNMEILPAQGVSRFRPEGAREALLHLCGEALAREVAERLVPEPLQPMAAAVALTPERFGRIPKAYFHCEQDNAITPQFQRRMALRYELRYESFLPTDHCPIFSAPQLVARELDEFSRRLG